MDDERNPYMQTWNWNLFFRWLLAHACIWWFILGLLAWRADKAIAWFLFGLILGGTQWLVLRRYSTRGGWWWVVATTAGWLVGRMPFFLVTITFNWPVVGWAIMGALIGLGQWFIVRRIVAQAYWWVLANVVAMVAGRMVVQSVINAVGFTQGWGDSWFLAGAIYGGITGIVLIYLMRGSDYVEHVDG